MKRIFSLFFLFVFLFNVGGYYFVYWGLRIADQQTLTEKLDQELYSDHETYVFKVPLTLPYEINQEGYKRVNGSFEHDGQFYQLVKQKLENDTLYVVCIMDHEKKKVEDAFTTYAKLSNDLPVSPQKDGQNLLSKLSKEYESNIILEIVLTDGWFLSTFYADCSPALLQGEKNILAPPPKG
ncbi:MAG TPA: hypothetical protein VFW11_00215 [Cyclobacteriaceae bacterium]|nr:hypothetical protein [Cyclobacteriaceae bacterium]